MSEATTGGARPLHKDNNFDTLRIFAAYLVLVSHSYPLFGHGPEFVAAITGFETGGGLAVSIFFFISGYLVMGSLERRPDAFSYFLSRSLRILPGLFVAVAFCVFVVGVCFTTLPLEAYLASHDTWSFLLNSLVYPIQFRLPGVFEGSPANGSVNGSLWTLPIEVTMYFLLYFLFKAGLLSRKTSVIIPSVFISLFMVGVSSWGLGWENRGFIFFYSVPFFNFLMYGVYFFTGSAFFVYRNRIPVSLGGALAVAIVLVSSFHSVYGPIVELLSLPYLIYCMAHVRTGLGLGQRVASFGDVSYGVYIYAYPVQQSVYALFFESLGFWSMVLVSIATTSVFAGLSWKFVEKPALSLKNREMWH